MFAQLGKNASNEELVARMVDMAKHTITVQQSSDQKLLGTLKIEDYLDNRDDETKRREEGVVAPSLLEMCCNLMEAVRLREDLTYRIHESDVLAALHKE
jgi:hypothetical protein